ncbi:MULTISPECIES: DUF2339 domain-containing protein [unclassified Chryseobacterium]|uniref:DUF2339 domain-containing protein n=1 Tax=unclassified Chryseobacterium TaxID=2593645 RepID=UPI002269FE71|nr:MULTISPECIES: DUF2339 domain-containing protein [unclassified Chryseobacterium]
MNSIFIIILIIAIVLVYASLVNRINDLERKVADLMREKSSEVYSKEITPKAETAAQPELSKEVAFENELQNVTSKPLQEEVIQVPQKDWMKPVFDFLKQNALTIIGIFTLVLGIGYFVKYAIDKKWIGETPRVGIGIATGAIIMTVGHFLRKNYNVFASIITGGGIAVLYFTITIAFREYHLFTQNTAFVVTCLITLLSIGLSYFYKSEILIIFSLFGGFLAPLMISTGQSNYPFLFTYLMVLNVGMLIIVFLKHWKSVGWIAFVFTNIYLFYWTIEKTEILSVYFYVISYIVFYAFALQDYFKKNTLSIADILMLVLINFSSIIGLVYTFNELKYEPVIIFPIIFALVNSVLLFKEYSKKSFEINYSTFSAITVSLVTIAIALQFKTHLITSVWAIEATLLLFIWKRTNHNIFKICFYILFPLVIIAQIITWGEYFSSDKLNIVFNPVFLTSSVTVITTLSNLFLLRKLTESEEKENNFFENLFILASYGIIYFALLFELIYHISHKPWSIIFGTGILYSIYFIFVLLLLRKVFDISKEFKIGLSYLFLFLVIINSSVSGLSIIESIISKKIDSSFYALHLLYLIPFVFIGWKILPKIKFFSVNISYWIFSLALISVVSFELYHIYNVTNSNTLAESYELEKHFSILYLPIIWAILSSLFIYIGLKNSVSELTKVGFALIGIVVLKLYAYDVWQMDNVSRIVAFIILGIILLLSSFTFQRLKNIIKNLVDHKEENIENETTESQ